MWTSSMKKKATSISLDMRIIDAPLDNWAQVWAHTRLRWHHISHITPFWHATVEKIVKYNILTTVCALGGDICVISSCRDWTSISTSCIFFKNASFPVSVFQPSCHSVPLLLNVLTLDIVSVSQSLTIRNSMCPWTVLSVCNVHTLKADRL